MSVGEGEGMLSKKMFLLLYKIIFCGWGNFRGALSFCGIEKGEMYLKVGLKKVKCIRRWNWKRWNVFGRGIEKRWNVFEGGWVESADWGESLSWHGSLDQPEWGWVNRQKIYVCLPRYLYFLFVIFVFIVFLIFVICISYLWWYISYLVQPEWGRVNRQKIYICLPKYMPETADSAESLGPQDPTDIHDICYRQAVPVKKKSAMWRNLSTWQILNLFCCHLHYLFVKFIL